MFGYWYELIVYKEISWPNHDVAYAGNGFDPVSTAHNKAHHHFSSPAQLIFFLSAISSFIAQQAKSLANKSSVC